MIGKLKRRADAHPSDALGTAQWMDAGKALKKFAFDDSLFVQNDDGLWEGRSNGQIWVGESLDTPVAPIGYKDDRHVLLVSGTRGGKGTGVIIPNLCLWPGSAIVIDPKGENATVTARRRGAGSEYCYGLGQTVRILDPFGEVQLDPSLKARYNPLDAIDPRSDFAVDDAGRIAAALVVIENKHDPFWEQAARNLIKALILYVLTHRNFAGRRNLVSVWRLLRQGDWITVERARRAGQEKIPSGFTLLWHGMKRSEAYKGLIAGEGEQMLDMHERTRPGILKVAAAATEFIDGPPMQRLLEASDFDLAAIKTDPQGLSLYLTLPQRYMTTHYRWLRLMISLAVGEMERIKRHPATGHPTLFLLDEFAGLQRMEAVEHAAAQAAGFGVKFFFVLQNLPQLKEIYDESWETFIGNSGLRLFFQIDDNFTRSYLAQQLGEREVLRQTHSGSRSDSTSASTNDGQSSSRTAGSSFSTTEGENSGRSWSRTTGWSHGISTNYGGLLGLFAHSRGHQSGSSGSEARSTSQGWSHSRSDSRSQSFSNSTSSSRSESFSRSVTDGWGETVHKRLLLNPDEIGRFLARIDDLNHPAHPGIVLMLTPGEHPLPSHRINYFSSQWLEGFFDPHPDYPLPPTLAERIRRLRELIRPEPSAPTVPKRRRMGVYASAFALIFVFVALVGWLARGHNSQQHQTAAQNAPGAQPGGVPELLKAGDDAYSSKKYSEAFRSYREAAELGSAEAQLDIGDLYWNGEGVLQDDIRAVSWYQKAAEHGNADAQTNLGEAYEIGRGVSRDPKVAAIWYHTAADQGQADAQAALGRLFAQGQGVDLDYAQSFQWLKKAADQGNAQAQSDLAALYVNGLGVDRDYDAARQLIQRAADQGNPDALKNLGALYLNGWGVEHDDKQAAMWFRKAADLDNPDAEAELGALYAAGRGVERDYIIALQWLRKAAAHENSQAELNIGLIYQNGEGVQRNYVEAWRWFRMAANNGNPGAQCALGLLYANGQGVARNMPEALSWFRKAADQGNPEAQYDLGFAYFRGDGVDRDMGQAHEWMKKAAAGGVDLAKQWLNYH